MRSLILLALMAAAFAAPNAPQRIVGGQTASIEDFPYVTNMHHRRFGIIWSQQCGGSLITPTKIVSSGHCYYRQSTSSWRALLGTSLTSSGGTQHTVNDILLHSEYDDDSYQNDLAILTLATAATLSNTIGTINLAGPNYVLPDGTAVTTVGYGRLADGGSESSELRSVNTVLVNQTVCAERYAFLKTQPGYSDWPVIVDGMICAGLLNVGGAGACDGDQGGPLVHSNNVLVGMVSWSYGCANAYYPGVYVRINNYVNWIIANAS